MLLLALLGRRLEQETPDEPRIWVLEELDAATAMRLDPRLCMGVVTIAGGFQRARHATPPKPAVSRC
jgi:phosphocarrier protein FPr